MLRDFSPGEFRHACLAHEVLPGIPWGRPEWVLSPAYWASLASSLQPSADLFESPKSLLEEVAFCILGGFGITAEVNCAAHEKLKSEGLYEGRSSPTISDIETILIEPLDVDGRKVRYRFPSQKSRRLAPALARLKSEVPPAANAHELRTYLLSFPGIGPKTASWITRNWLDTDSVAIIDIHVERAGRMIGLFDEGDILPRDYFRMEEKFLTFAGAIGVRPSILDIAIWSTMRKLGKVVRQ